jgi:ABC-type multidrug transport system fused ATPase/permease subunit
MQMERTSISSRLLARYLAQPYEFFLARNTAVLSKTLLSETDDLIGNLLLPLSQLVAHGAIVCAVLTLIVCYDAAMAFCIILVVAALYGVIFGLVRKRLERIGKEWQVVNGQRYQACNEALSGIKDVKITHSSLAYQQSYFQASRTFCANFRVFLAGYTRVGSHGFVHPIIRIPWNAPINGRESSFISHAFSADCRVDAGRLHIGAHGGHRRVVVAVAQFRSTAGQLRHPAPHQR